MKSNIALHATARLIADRLRQMRNGEIITYEQLAKDVAVPCVNRREEDKRGFDALLKARRKLLDEGVFFEVIKNVGLRRLSPAEIARGEGQKSVDKIRRVARKGMKIVRIALTSDTLNNEDRVRASTDAAVLGALVLFTDAEKAKKIEGAIRKGQMRVSFGATLQLFNKTEERVNVSLGCARRGDL